ncbi:MAG: hypothetical protein WC927_00485 [Bacilli bacterium]|jgi:hypothetical protein
MYLINNNNKILDELLLKLQNEEELFQDEFQKNMGIVSIHTLVNVNYIIEEYLNNYQDNNSNGKKMILIFGLLQGLFAGIDSLYSLGKALDINKLLINLNQNKTLKNIKRIRNDVVGHPSYRYYNNKSIGYCSMDVDRITSSNIVYYCYTDETNESLQKNKTEVNMIDVINNYFKECNQIIESTLRFIDIKKTIPDICLLDEVVLLFRKFQKNIKDDKSLIQVREVYTKLLNLQHDSNDRVIWRIDNILYMFQLDSNEFVNHLINLELKKLYELFYILEKQINNNVKHTKLYFYGSDIMNKLKRKIKKFTKYNKDIYTDTENTLFYKLFKDLIRMTKNDEKYNKLSNWLNKIYINNDKIMLYAVGSFLKAN